MKKIVISIILTAVVVLVFSYAGKSQLAEEVRLTSTTEYQESTDDSAHESLEDKLDEVADETIENQGDVDYPVFAMEKDMVRSFKFDEGDFWTIRMEASQEETELTRNMVLEGDSGTIYFFKDGEWISEPLRPGVVEFEGFMMIATDAMHYMLSSPDTYEELGFGTRVSREDLNKQLVLTEEEGRWSVTYSYENGAEVHHVIWGISSPQPLIDYENETVIRRFAGYDFHRKARFLEDGYYYESPGTYTPTDEDAYWRSPSMYLVTHFVNNNASVAESLLAKGWLMVGKGNLSNKGYFVSLPRSEWLYSDYGIEDGFFDTRFNGDMTTTYLKAYQDTGIEAYRQVYLELAEYYISHASTRHFTYGENNQGWLVYDYYHDETSVVPVHTSLNHQVHAISMFLRLFLEEGDQRYFETGMRMLWGVKLTKEQWIKEDGDLHYALLSDGTMGFQDYPELTKNDMETLQALLAETFYGEDPDIQYLIDVKKAYLDKN